MLHDIIHLFSDSCRNFSPGKKRNEGKKASSVSYGELFGS